MNDWLYKWTSVSFEWAILCETSLTTLFWGYLYGVLTPMIFWWLSFGIIAILNFKAYKKKDYDFKRYERYYILLSYFSKAFMGYYLTFGLTRDSPDTK